jgi:hypothetical protein
MKHGKRLLKYIILEKENMFDHWKESQRVWIGSLNEDKCRGNRENAQNYKSNHREDGRNHR